jgi:hypothetical protein
MADSFDFVPVHTIELDPQLYAQRKERAIPSGGVDKYGPKHAGEDGGHRPPARGAEEHVQGDRYQGRNREH